MDPTGRCRLTAWCEFDPKPGDTIRVEGEGPIMAGISGYGN